MVVHFLQFWERPVVDRYLGRLGSTWKTSTCDIWYLYILVYWQNDIGKWVGKFLNKKFKKKNKRQ